MSANLESEVRSIMKLYSEARFKLGLERALALHKAAPNLAVTNYCVGHGLGAMQHLRDAVPYLRKAAQLEPRNADFLIRYSRALLDLGRIREAESNLMRAREINPKLSIIPWTLAIFYSSINRFDLAVPYFEQFLSLDMPEQIADGARLDWAHALIEVGRSEEAEPILRGLLGSAKARGAALAHLSNIKAFPLGSHEDGMIDQLLEQTGLSNLDRYVLLSTKARSFAAAKDYANEYALLKEGKKARGGKDTIRDFTRLIDDTIAGFTPEMIAELSAFVGNQNFRPIFVLGLPRSGTTLTEKILSGHSKVGGAGELTQIADFFFSVIADRPASQFLPQARALGRSAVLERLSEIEATMRFLCPGKERVVDKMPHNFLYCGVIAAMFPAARIVHVFRSPADNFLSGFKATLNPLHSYFDAPEVFIPYFEQYRRLMEHWYKVLPQQMFPLHYERLVTDPNGTIAELLDFCGLDWEEDCLYPERSSSRIGTASVMQARQPINANSVGGWKKYADQLQVIVDRLGDGLFTRPRQGA